MTLNHVKCLKVIYVMLYDYYCRNGFLVTDKQPLLKEALHVLVGKIKTLGTTQVSFQDLIR